MTESLRIARNLLLDCDGVLFDWVEGFARYCEARLGRALDPDGPPEYNMGSWVGVDDDACMDMIRDFNNGDLDIFASLRPLPGAVEAMHMAQAQGRLLDIITACSTAPRVTAMREKNLIDVFGPIFRNIDFVDLGESKREKLLSYTPSIWVEDKYENALLGAECGHTAILISTSYNRQFHGRDHGVPLTIVENWDEVDMGCVLADPAPQASAPAAHP